MRPKPTVTEESGFTDDAARTWLRRCGLVLYPATDPPPPPDHFWLIARRDVAALAERLGKRVASPVEIVAETIALLTERGLLEHVERFTSRPAA